MINHSSPSQKIIIKNIGALALLIYVLVALVVPLPTQVGFISANFMKTLKADVHKIEVETLKNVKLQL